MVITRDKSFYTSFFSLLGVLVLQNVLALSVNLADNLMLGAYSESALSGAASVNQIQFIIQQVVFGIGDGLVVIAAQYWGQKRCEPIRRLNTIAVWTALVFSGIMFALVSMFPKGTLSLFTDNEIIITEGVAYLGIIRYTYPIFALTSVLLAALRSVEKVKIAFYVSLTALVVNCSLNYLLIGGNFGAPELGAKGAAIATLISRIIELAIVICFLIFSDKRLQLKFAEMFRIDPSLFKDYFRVSIPIIIVAALWGISTALQTVILGHMTAAAIAANAVAVTLFAVLKVISVGASSASSIIIGKTVGMDQKDKVMEYAKTLQLIFLAIGIFTSITLFFLRIPILNLYNLSDETKEMANAFLLVLCVTCIGTAYEMPVIGGVIRGGGDTKFILINDMISIWGVVLPLSFIAAFLLKWPPVAVIFCLNSDQIFKCAAAAIKVNRFRWIKKLTKDEKEATA